MVLGDFGVVQVFFSMMWFFLFVLWIMLLFRVFADIFRSRDLGGFGKVAWLIFVIVLPFLGAFVYIIARGRHMAEHDAAMIAERDEAMRAYVREASGGPSAAEELTRLAELHSKGVIDDAEFQRLKAKVLG